MRNTGTFTIASTGAVYGGGRFSQSAGKTTVDGRLALGSIAINSGTLAGTGTVASSSSVTLASAATLSPGDVCTLTVDAPLNLYGALAVDVNGRTGFDVLDVNNSVTLGPDSLFNFSLGDDSIQMAGDTFDFFNAGSFLNFNDVHFNINGLLAGLNFSVKPFNGNALQLSLFSTTGAGAAMPCRNPENSVCSVLDSCHWAEFLEMAVVLVGGRENIKVIITVRDLRDVCASFEKLYRKTAALGMPPLEAEHALKCKTALGRFELFIDDAQPVGRAYNAIRDAVTRGWKPQMHFVEYSRLTSKPKETLAGIYRFLGETSTEHDFNHIEQVTVEDDFVYGFKDLHVIRREVKPQPPSWPYVFDDAVFQSNAWENVEKAAEFWKLYEQPSRPPVTALAGHEQRQS